MSDELISCPLCCNKQFSNKQSLVTHLGDVISSLSCSICSKKFTSLEQLTEHLNHDNCQSSKINHRYTFHFCDEINDFISEEKDPLNEHLEESHTVLNEKGDNPDEAENILIETSCSQMEFPTEDLKLVQDIGNGQYMVLTSHDDIDKSGETILTKQNSDGTISLTNIKDTDSVITITQSIKKEAEVNEDELYSCNTCGVTFTSVIEHIQKYHNDQDVVVEEHVELTLDQELQELRKKEKELDEKRQSRRVITDTGDIVEDPLFVTYTPTKETIEQAQTLNNKPLLQLKKDEVREKRTQSKKYVQIDQFCDSVVKDIKKNDDKSGPYHKVIVKEVQILEDGQTKAKLYSCMSCSVTVTSLDQFKLHPCKRLKYNCPHCSVAYDNSKSLCAHMKVHKVTPSVTINNSNSSIIKYDSDIIGQFKCEICSTLFKTNKSLKLHKRMHDPLKARHIEPPVGTTDGDGPSEDKFLCSICDKLIPIGYRKVHQNSHKHNNKFNCDICNKKFTSTEYLQMHINVHNSEKSRVYKGDKALPYSCAFCPRQFSRPHEKVKHERIHTGEKPHSCAICGKSFRVAYCLTLHMRTHTGARPYECPHCSKRFKAHSVYNHHLLTHSEVRAYKCPYCPKAFKTSVQLAGHKNSHTKPFSCQHCNRPFASLYAVRVHTETHLRQNNLKFSCSWCGASYARTFALKDHIKQVHVKEYGESQEAQESQATELINELGINSNEADAVMVDQ